MVHAMSFSLHPEQSEEPSHLLLFSTLSLGLNVGASALRKSAFAFAFDLSLGLSVGALALRKTAFAFVFDFCPWD
jgi:hypothetical protein